MPRTVATQPTERHANSLRDRLDDVRPHSAKAEIVANVVAESELLPLIRLAMSETGTSQKAMAIDAGVAESVLSEALNGRRNFAAEWWWRQSDRFLLKFLELVMEARHLTPAVAREIRAERIKELIGLLLSEVA